MMTPKQLAQHWLANNALILDTETTGLDDTAEIIEISVIDTKGTVLLDTLVKPVGAIPTEVTAIHGITDEMVKDAPAWPQVYDLLVDIVMGRQLVIYNADYDLRLISQTDALHQLPTVITEADCAMEAYAEFWSEIKRPGYYKWKSLALAVQQEGVEVEGTAHRALADVKMTLGVIKAMANPDNPTGEQRRAVEGIRYAIWRCEEAGMPVYAGNQMITGAMANCQQGAIELTQ